MRYEGADGRTIIFYSNVDKLEKHLLEFSAQDNESIKDFIQGIRMCLNFEPPSDTDSPHKRLLKALKMGFLFFN